MAIHPLQTEAAWYEGKKELAMPEPGGDFRERIQAAMVPSSFPVTAAARRRAFAIQDGRLKVKGAQVFDLPSLLLRSQAR